MEKNFIALFARVVAVPALALSVASAAHAEGNAYCSLPGEIVIEGDTGPGGSGVSDPVPGQHVEALYFAEPGEWDGKLAITLKVDTLSPAPPPATVYQVFFMLDDGNVYYVAYEPDAAPEAQFSYGHSDSNQGSDTTDGAADAESNALADGTITWALGHSKIAALKTATFAGRINGLVKLRPGTADLHPLGYFALNHTAEGSYRLRGNAACASAAKLKPTGGAGGVSPLLLTPLLLVGWRRRAAIRTCN